MPHPRLLLIDDEPTLAEFLASAARESGFDPVITGDDEEFRKEFVAQRPDMVALDLGMPGISGLAEIAEKLERLPDIPVVRLAEADIVRHPLVASMLTVL